MSISRLPVEQGPASNASARVKKAFEAITHARRNADALKRDAESKMRDEILTNLRIVIDTRRSHLRLASLFSGLRGASLPLDHAVEIEDGTNIDDREIGIYVRTVSEALAVAASSERQ